MTTPSLSTEKVNALFRELMAEARMNRGLLEDALKVIEKYKPAGVDEEFVLMFLKDQMARAIKGK